MPGNISELPRFIDEGIAAMFRTLFRLMSRNRVRLALSAACVLVALFDTFVSSLSAVGAGFLAIAAMPWLVHLFEKVVLPGGFEIVMKKTEQELERTGAMPDQRDIDAFEGLETNDPNLALAALRIEIEKRLRRIVGQNENSRSSRSSGIPRMIDELVTSGKMSSDIASLIRDMLPAMNSAAHGMDLPADTARWVLDNGPRLLALLDDKL